MKKYILPWEEHDDFFGRKVVETGFFIHIVWKDPVNGIYTVYRYPAENHINFTTKELAMSYADKCCLEDGFIEIPERLRPLL